VKLTLGRGRSMAFRRGASRFLAAAAGVSLLGMGGAGTAGASPGPAPSAAAAAAVGGMRITGKFSFTVTVPADDVVTGGVSGKETQTGTVNVDLESASLPYGGGWTDEGSDYSVKEDIDVTATLPGGGGATTYTGNVADSGRFPANSDTDGIDAGWAHPVARSSEVQVWVAPVVQEPITVNANGVAMQWQALFQPACDRTDSDGGAGLPSGPFDAKSETVDMDCNFKTDDGVEYDVKGTLHVDPFMFILPRNADPNGGWENALTKEHHDYPAADIPVRSGTPYFAVTAGRIAYSGKTCGLGITLIGTNGVHYIYCHSSERLVPEGDYVAPGTELGLTGDTGSAEGHPHLHFEIRINNVKRCPQTLLWDLYRGTKPPPDYDTIHALPAKGCWYPGKKK
jgi:murein DD-endopeptidase MepM/ murein hydrolase activator NlpD